MVCFLKLVNIVFNNENCWSMKKISMYLFMVYKLFMYIKDIFYIYLEYDSLNKFL